MSKMSKVRTFTVDPLSRAKMSMALFPPCVALHFSRHAVRLELCPWQNFEKVEVSWEVAFWYFPMRASIRSLKFVFSHANEHPLTLNLFAY